MLVFWLIISFFVGDPDDTQWLGDPVDDQWFYLGGPDNPFIEAAGDPDDDVFRY